MFQKHWLHPINLLVVLVVVAVMAIMSAESFFALGNSWAKIAGDTSMVTKSDWSWAHMISAAFWVIGFSAGIVGAAMNLSQALRMKGSDTKDFSVIKDLDEDEVKDLNLWLDSNTYGPEHLKRLWKEDDR